MTLVTQICIAPSSRFSPLWLLSESAAMSSPRETMLEPMTTAARAIEVHRDQRVWRVSDAGW